MVSLSVIFSCGQIFSFGYLKEKIDRRQMSVDLFLLYNTLKAVVRYIEFLSISTTNSSLYIYID